MAIWLVSENGDLRKYVQSQFKRYGRVVKKPNRFESQPRTIPQCVVLECDYDCRNNCCKDKIEFFGSFSGIPQIIARKNLFADFGLLESKFYFIELLSSEFKRLPKNAFLEKATRNHPLFYPALIQSIVVENRGKYRTIDRLIENVLSTRTILRRFKTVTGISVHSFIEKISLCHAMFDLVIHNKLVKQVAYENNSNPFSFSRRFYRVMGYRPSILKRK